MAPAASVPWSDLPKEIWAAIGRCLDSHMDVLRFRSVCTTWRFLIPSSLPSAPRLPISVPFLDGARGGSISLFQSTIYSLHPSLDDPSSSSPGWLIKIAQQSASDHGSESGSTIQLLNPLTDRQIKFNSGTFPNLVNLLNFRVTEVCKEYKLRHAEGHPVAGVQKVLLSPNSPWTDVEEIVIVGLFHRKLRLWKYGRKSWRVIKGAGQLRFEDIIHYRGQFYAVDELGTVYWIDSAMRVVQFSPPMCGGGDWKHLVELNGDLYVVDQYLKERVEYGEFMHRQGRNFKVYRLDQVWGRWEEVRSLDGGGATFFLGLNCSFAVSVENNFLGCPANCIYYGKDERSSKPFTRANVFSMADRTIKRMAYNPEYLQIVWPPPAWVTPTTPASLDLDNIVQSF